MACDEWMNECIRTRWSTDSVHIKRTNLSFEIRLWSHCLWSHCLYRLIHWICTLHLRCFQCFDCLIHCTWVIIRTRWSRVVLEIGCVVFCLNAITDRLRLWVQVHHILITYILHSSLHTIRQRTHSLHKQTVEGSMSLSLHYMLHSTDDTKRKRYRDRGARIEICFLRRLIQDIHYPQSNTQHVTLLLSSILFRFVSAHGVYK